METESRSDEELLAAAAAGDQESFARLMRRHEDMIFALALRIVGDRSDALDATQDAFINAYRQAHRFRGDAAFSTWLYRVAVNACKDLLRRRNRAPRPEEDEVLAQMEQISTRAGDDSVIARLTVGEALAHLPADYRDAVVMHDLGGLPYEEIAARTGVAIGTVKSRISRGRRRLAEVLEQPSPPTASKEVP